ncbi:MAG TPA: DUF1549 and DUF1553 domain-containing protein [Gemmataceae bacterium]|nr:DUF1549 and DUF1553 domain-containing protein [Gemmataceae bacterium]
MQRSFQFTLPSICFLVTLAVATSPTDCQEGVTKHWSLRQRTKPQVPQFTAAKDRKWITNRIDAFVLAALHKKGLTPAPEADRRTLIRRLSFDLLGLPPSPAEIEQFVNDKAEDAYERLVDRLLASPHYGERWGRHWLDVVRFAESEGFEYDRVLPGLWRYRDYVIQSFNKDKPYDQFVREQLAGDEINDKDTDCLIAAGFYRIGPVRRNAGNQKITFSKLEILNDRVDVIGPAFMGMTVGCARCHDHKYDDIPHADYYRLQAFLAAMDENDVPVDDKGQPAAPGKKTTPGKGKGAPAVPVINSVRNYPDNLEPIHVLKRGDPERKGKQVGPRALGMLLPADSPELPPKTPNLRTILAKWLTTPDHPLTARVMVNRVWQYHFGTGIVESSNDFGMNGAAPSHPELLDDLANTFVEGGWKLKPLHRLIVLSSTYRQSSQVADAKASKEMDPANRLLWHFSQRRLDAEEVRDAMLSAAGVLNPKAGGPSVLLPVDKDLVDQLYDKKQWVVTKDHAEHNRRSVYLLSKRNLRLPFNEAFDQPDTLTSCSRRESSTHPLQALEMLNGKTANQLAEAFAERFKREAGKDTGKQVELAYMLVAGRPPNERERTLGVEFLKTQPPREFALALFNLNAFIYVN